MRKTANGANCFNLNARKTALSDIPMKNLLSLIACGIICIVLLQYRVNTIPDGKPLNVTQWDAFGYYMYLPSICIYHDYKKLGWLTEIDKKYGVTGGDGWQAQKEENGNYVFKYLGGVAIMELPFFYTGHFIAKQYGYPVDGFSPPYMYALAFGVIFYCMLALLLLRNVLLRYFKDSTVALTLLLLCLATNFIQYVAVDNGLSHAYIFPLYVLVIYTTLKWHERPRTGWALLTGYIIGLATISRPTEAIMLFIPLMWQLQHKEAAREKWRLVKANKAHVAIAVFGGLLGILPQLIYWKLSSGHFIYDVGSKWQFLTPWFRVLFGWEKGWFIYTPVTVFFIAGMFFMKRFPFQKSVLWFCLLNIWIIIAWDDWRYGGSFSTRALMQSYPVFALALASFTDYISTKRWRPVFYASGAYLLAVNLFQTWQYDNTVLHFNDMNRHYYAHIYLNAHPTPLDMSLLDNEDFLHNEQGYTRTVLLNMDTSQPVHFNGGEKAVLAEIPVPAAGDNWLKIEASVKAPGSLWRSELEAGIPAGDSVKKAHVRLYRPLIQNDTANEYAFYLKVPSTAQQAVVSISLSSPYNFGGTVEKLVVTQLRK
jgi:hypothetical protein